MEKKNHQINHRPLLGNITYGSQGEYLKTNP
jgi:hypothetical protein